MNIIAGILIGLGGLAVLVLLWAMTLWCIYDMYQDLKRGRL